MIQGLGLEGQQRTGSAQKQQRQFLKRQVEEGLARRSTDALIASRGTGLRQREPTKRPEIEQEKNEWDRDQHRFGHQPEREGRNNNKITGNRWSTHIPRICEKRQNEK